MAERSMSKPGFRSSVYLYCHPSMADLSQAVVKLCHAVTETKDKRLKFERQMSVSSQRSVEFSDSIQWQEFPDGFPNLFIEDVKKLAGRDVLFLGSFHTPSVIFEQLSLIYSIPRYLARSFHFILPYFPTGTMERVDTEGQIATAMTLARLLSAIPLTARGPAQIIIFDIHALQERFYFSESVIPRLMSAVPLLQKVVSELPEKELISYAFPDDGAYKRFHHYFPGDHTIVCNKVREGQKKVVTIKEGKASGRHVIIVDDLVQTGGTLKECAKVLRQSGALSVSAYVTHAVFPNESWRQFTGEEGRFSNFWITNSLPHASLICRHAPFKLLSLASIIADMLIEYDLITL